MSEEKKEPDVLPAVMSPDGTKVLGSLLPDQSTDPWTVLGARVREEMLKRFLAGDNLSSELMPFEVRAVIRASIDVRDEEIAKMKDALGAALIELDNIASYSGAAGNWPLQDAVTKVRKALGVK